MVRQYAIIIAAGGKRPLSGAWCAGGNRDAVKRRACAALSGETRLMGAD
jgi:hypothetical protein